MESIITNHATAIILGVSIMFGIIGAAVVYVMGNKITSVHMSRTGVAIYSNDIGVWSEIIDEIERIDSNTRKNMCMATSSMMLVDAMSHNLSAESVLVNLKANQPLFHAVYENHHTREIVDGGVDTYIENKTYAVLESVRIWKGKFPEISEGHARHYACLWVKKLTQILQRACSEKIAFYKSQKKRKDMSDPLKAMITERIERNEHYIECINELSERSDIAIHSSVLLRRNLS